jgi:ADP-ribosyl-[dinitrogen reductase] hydrolase
MGEEMALDVAEMVQERIVGAMLGLACGDALGAPAEFKSPAEVQRRWGRIADMVGGGQWAPGEWTDDTGMTLCMAEGILQQPDDPVAEVGKRFLEWQQTAKDVGATISAAIGNYRRHGSDWSAAARDTPQAQSGKAAGNGSLMRTLPVALAYRDNAALLKQSARLSAMTHFDPQAEVCCAVYCLWIKRLLRGQPPRSAWQDAVHAGRAVAQHGPVAPDTPGPSPLPDNFWSRLEAIPALTYAGLQPSGYAGYVVECLEAAVWCCLHAGSLEEALVQAVNLAGESDTIAAVAGGAAGAYWGTRDIPSRWLEALYQRDRVEEAGKQLAARHRNLAGYSQPSVPPFEYNWVAPRLFAGRNPLTTQDVEELADLGVTHYLDLREDQEYAPPKLGAEALKALEQAKIVRKRLPVTDMGAPHHRAFSEAIDFLQSRLETPDNRVYVSCRAGKERTAAVLIAYYATHHGVNYEAALTALRTGRPLLNPLPRQEEAVRQFLAQSMTAGNAH